MEVAGAGRGGGGTFVFRGRTRHWLLLWGRLHDLAITSLVLRSEKIVLFMKQMKK